MKKSDDCVRLRKMSGDIPAVPVSTDATIQRLRVQCESAVSSWREGWQWQVQAPGNWHDAKRQGDESQGPQRVPSLNLQQQQLPNYL